MGSFVVQRENFVNFLEVVFESEKIREKKLLLEFLRDNGLV